MHHFKTDVIKNMDHMRISGKESSSVILSQTKKWKKWKGKSKRDGVLNPKNINSSQF